jgi:hypothetical protein
MNYLRRRAMRRLNTQQAIAGGCAIVIAVAAFLPWVSLFGVYRIGLQGDGALTIIIAGIALATLAAQAWSRVVLMPIVGVDTVLTTAATVCLLISAVHMNQYAALGLWTTLIASVAMTAVAGFALARDLALGRRLDSEIDTGFPEDPADRRAAVPQM